MNKFLTWFQRSVWPWSRMQRAESLTRALLENSRLRDQTEMMIAFEMFLGRELGNDQMMELVNKFNKQIEQQYGLQGLVGRPDKSAALGTFPPPGTGEIDPKITNPIARAVAEAAKAAQEKQEKSK